MLQLAMPGYFGGGACHAARFATSSFFTWTFGPSPNELSSSIHHRGAGRWFCATVSLDRVLWRVTPGGSPPPRVPFDLVA